MQSRYSRLGTKRESDEMYTGIWNGERVSFRRVFRGHRFTDDECEALCRGECIDVYDLHYNDRPVGYAVRGQLEEKVIQGFAQEFRDIAFKPMHDISNAREFRDFGATSQTKSSLISELGIDSFSDEEEAKLAARLRGDSFPEIVKVSTNASDVPVYLPKKEVDVKQQNIKENVVSSSMEMTSFSESSYDTKYDENLNGLNDDEDIVISESDVNNIPDEEFDINEDELPYQDDEFANDTDASDINFNKEEFKEDVFVTVQEKQQEIFDRLSDTSTADMAAESDDLQELMEQEDAILRKDLEQMEMTKTSDDISDTEQEYHASDDLQDTLAFANELKFKDDNFFQDVVIGDVQLRLLEDGYCYPSAVNLVKNF